MKNKKIERMVGISLLLAVMIVLQFLASVFPIKIGPFPISLVLIPIVLGAATYGVVAGCILGGAFGVMTYIFCVNGMDIGGQMVFQASPVLCFLVVMAKGILCGLASGFVYRILHKTNGYVAMLCAAIICPVVNTGVFLIGMSLFFMDVLRAWAGGTDVVGYILSGLILINFLPELGINIVFSPAGQRILRAIKKN